MSFGFSSFTERLVDIRESLRSAYRLGIVIFAAASNGGGNNGLTYPANEDEVIGIGATDGKGNKSDFTPGPYPDQKNFSTLGEGVMSSWPRKLSSAITERSRVMSGTSVATPIAAGIAGMVMDYLRQLPEDTDDNLDFLLSQLKSKKGMEAALLKLTETRDGFHYIVPWTLFKAGRQAGIPQVLLDALRTVLY